MADRENKKVNEYYEVRCENMENGKAFSKRFATYYSAESFARKIERSWKHSKTARKGLRLIGDGFEDSYGNFFSLDERN